MKVGDLVMRIDRLVRDSLGVGIVINIQDTHEKDMPFYQVKWQRGTTDLYWYDGPELEVINEAR
tara:strand:+ start:316 stop:507 length:192 start_codon:yes stop_codon:yes gene_type:complete